MRKRITLSYGIMVLVISLAVGYVLLLDVLSNMGNPNGDRAPDYFIMTEPVTVKKIELPKGIKLTYEEHLPILPIHFNFSSDESICPKY
ncbi:hypothetical protein GCM10022217_10460 [Chryseobacterium ginsenosidimutans]